MGLFALSTLLVAGAGVYIFSKVFPNFQPGNKKVQADLKEMKAEMNEKAAALIPLETKDLELLASEEADRSVKKGITKKVNGNLVTIYHEPAVVYSYKKYVSSSGKDAVLYARTTAHDYFFWVKAKGTKVVIDDNLVGTLQNREKLFSGKSDRLLARIDRGADEYMPVVIQGNEVAGIAKPGSKEKGTLSTRAFGYVKEVLSPEERAVLMALTIFELVMRKLE